MGDSEYRDQETGRFLPKNEFWKARSSHGRKPIFDSPDQLWDACCEYFQWVTDNPLYAAEVVKYQGEATLTSVPKMRAMSIAALCIFLDIETKTWYNYKDNTDFLQVTTRVDEIIKSQKFEGAAAEFLNANIIARDLGLAEKKDLNHSGLTIEIVKFGENKNTE